PWYAILAPHFGAAPLFVRVRDAASGAPLMLLPLVRRREGGLVVVEFADLGVSDYHAPLLASHAPALYAHESLLWAQIEAALRPADILRFEKAPPFVAAARNPLFDLARRHMNFCAWDLRLGAGRAAFEENLPDQAFRRELARKNRRIGGRGRVCFREETEAAGLARAFEILCAQRAARFARLGRSDILQSAPFRAFYETVALAPHNRIARLFTLSVDDEIVATNFGLQRKERFCLVMSTIGDERWKSASPGNVAIDRLVSLLIEERSGALDFTIGDEPYKKKFGAIESELGAGLVSMSWRGSPQLAVDLARRAMCAGGALSFGRTKEFFSAH
ncbi:MAG: GNAT family N-acetyltransferase, partial [Rhodoblastus sp.]